MTVHFQMYILFQLSSPIHPPSLPPFAQPNRPVRSFSRRTRIGRGCPGIVSLAIESTIVYVVVDDVSYSSFSGRTYYHYLRAIASPALVSASIGQFPIPTLSMMMMSSIQAMTSKIVMEDIQLSLPSSLYLTCRLLCVSTLET
jgi:hypothetical protein